MRERRILTIRPGSPGTVHPLAECRVTPEGRLEGYAVVWEAISEPLGGFVETIQRGAVELVSDVLATFNHDPDQVLGRTASGTLAVTIDDQGVKYEIDVPDTTTGRDVRELVRRGDVAGSSFTFETLEPPKWRKVDGVDLRVVTKLRLYELGPVTMPAYPDTTAAVRSLPRGARAGERIVRPGLAALSRIQELGELRAGHWRDE